MAARNFETHKVYHSNDQNTLPPIPSNRFFYHPDSGCSRDQPRPGSLFRTTREAEERDPGNEVAKMAEPYRFESKRVHRKLGY